MNPKPMKKISGRKNCFLSMAAIMTSYWLLYRRYSMTHSTTSSVPAPAKA